MGIILCAGNYTDSLSLRYFEMVWCGLEGVYQQHLGKWTGLNADFCTSYKHSGNFFWIEMRQNFTSKFQLGMCDDSRWSHRAQEDNQSLDQLRWENSMDSWWYRKPAREPWGPWVVVAEIWISLFGSHEPQSVNEQKRGVCGEWAFCTWPFGDLGRV